MKTHSMPVSTLGLMAMSLLLGACGGGGSSGSSSGGGGGGGGGSVVTSHNAGQDCLSCHRVGGSGAAKGIFTVAGTAYRNDGSAQANGTVRLYPDGSSTVQATLTTDSLGNFWTTQTVAALVPASGQVFVQGVRVRVDVTGGGSRTMSGLVSNGSCNSCHSPGGGVGRIAAQQADASHVTAASFAGNADAAPAAVGPRQLAQVVVGDAHSCVVKVSGAVSCWGANGSGQLGNGSTLATEYVSGVALFGVTALNAAGDTTCARVGDAVGAIYCWGALVGGGSAIPQYMNASDAALLPAAAMALRDGNPPASGGVVQNVPGLESVAFVQIATGATHSCGITTDDRLKCWDSGASVDIPVN